VASIVFAAQVNGKIQAGDVNGALDCSQKAKLFAWISFGIGMAMHVLTVIYYVVVFLAVAADSSLSNY